MKRFALAFLLLLFGASAQAYFVPTPVPGNLVTFTCFCPQPAGGGGYSCNGGAHTIYMQSNQCAAAMINTEMKWIEQIGCDAVLPDIQPTIQWEQNGTGYDLHVIYTSLANDYYACSAPYRADTIVGNSSGALVCPPQPPFLDRSFDSVQGGTVAGVPWCYCPDFAPGAPMHWLPQRDGGGTCLPSFWWPIQVFGHFLGVPDPVITAPPP